MESHGKSLVVIDSHLWSLIICKGCPPCRRGRQALTKEGMAALDKVLSLVVIDSH